MLRDGNILTVMQEEFKEKAPLLHDLISSAAMNRNQLEKNKIKTKEMAEFGILLVEAMILNIRNFNMNTMQAINAIALRRGGLDKKGFARMNACFVTTSYDVALKLQEELGEDYEKPVLEWSGIGGKEVGFNPIEVLKVLPKKIY